MWKGEGQCINYILWVDGGKRYNLVAREAICMHWAELSMHSEKRLLEHPHPSPVGKEKKTWMARVDTGVQMYQWIRRQTSIPHIYIRKMTNSPIFHSSTVMCSQGLMFQRFYVSREMSSSHILGQNGNLKYMSHSFAYCAVNDMSYWWNSFIQSFIHSFLYYVPSFSKFIQFQEIESGNQEME